MKKLLFYLLILVIPAAVYLNPQARDFLAYKLSFSLCDKPIAYKVDTVDSKFNLSRDEFISDVDQATKIWENPSGKDLFVYDPKAELSINLIFGLQLVNLSAAGLVCHKFPAEPLLYCSTQQPLF